MKEAEKEWTVLTRRQVLAGAAALVAGGSPGRAKADSNGGNLYDILAQYRFLDQNGAVLDAAQFRKDHKDEFVVVSYFYKGCGSTDPDILTKQAELANAIKPRKLLHLVIDTHTFYDAPLQGDAGRDAFFEDITGKKPYSAYPAETKYLAPGAVVALYPVDKDWLGKPVPFKSEEAATASIFKIEYATDPGGFPPPADPVADPGHYSTLSFFGPDGNSIADPLPANKVNVQRWADAIKNYKQPGQSR